MKPIAIGVGVVFAGFFLLILAALLSASARADEIAEKHMGSRRS